LELSCAGAQGGFASKAKGAWHEFSASDHENTAAAILIGAMLNGRQEVP
jgi:hypothetical protein